VRQVLGRVRSAVFYRTQPYLTGLSKMSRYEYMRWLVANAKYDGLP
jgi:hypothetical protein